MYANYYNVFIDGSMTKTIVTSALPYVYGIPHLGNFVGSVLPADVYYKYLRMKNEDAIFICGSDQHGTPIELRAIKEKITPKELADKMHSIIKDIFNRYECTFTYYGKTDTEENRATVYAIFEALNKNGYIIEREEIQAYCEEDKRFLVDRLIEGICPYCNGLHARGDQCDDCGKLLSPTQIINPHCMICGSEKIEFLKVKNLAIALDKLQDKIKEFIIHSSINGWSKNAINKSLSLINTEGLKPRDITRNMKWGFQVPLINYRDFVFYVWFDAVIGYIGITKEWNKTKWSEYWTDNKTRLIQFMGKDNIEFHTLMFPGILLGSDMDYTLPYIIKSSENLTSKNIKFSKSRGIGLNLESALGIAEPDYWRFVLIYLYPENSDSEFSVEMLKEIINNIMNGKIGNLVNRVLTLAKKSGIVFNKISDNGDEEVDKIIKDYKESFEKIELKSALNGVIEMANLGNTIISNTEPWKLMNKEDTDKLSSILNRVIKIIYDIGIMLWPFAPKAAMDILFYFDIEEEPKLSLLEKFPILNIEKEIKVIFNKISKEKIYEIEKFG